jgi:hypothetical protein
MAAPASALVRSGAAEIDLAVEGLSSSPVFVSDNAEDVVSRSEAEDLADEIRTRGAGPMYVVVLPEAAAGAAGGDPVGVLSQIQSRLNRPGVYAGIVGNSFRAGATSGVLPRGRGGQIATESFEARRSDGAAAVLTEFIGRVGQAKASGDSGGSGSSEGGEEGSGIGSLILLGLLGLGGLVWYFRRKRRQREEFAAVKTVARDDLVALGDEIRALDVDASMPDANPEAKAHYNEAVEIYTHAEERFDRARTPEDLAPVSEELEHGRYEMQAARCLFEGKAAPERRAPCFFDPRHGPSEREVEWAPPGGTPRPVPACAADALRVEEGLDPRVREIEYAGQTIPYWAAPAPFTPWFGGFWGGYGGFGGFLPGLLIGEMLGGGFGGFGHDPGSDMGGVGPGDFGGGDFGGGGFGGGDFGGGDFGGGDF